MPDLQDRPQIEAQFTRRMLRLSTRHKEELRRLLGDPPDPRNVPPQFWAKVQRENEEELLLILLLIAQETSLDLMGDLFANERGGVTLQMQVAAAVRARQFATARARDVSTVMVENTQEALRRRSQRWRRPDLEIDTPGGGVAVEVKPETEVDGQLDADLDALFGRARMTNLSVTETTIAHTAGINSGVLAGERAGMVLRVIWRTADEDACEICAPLEGLDMEEWIPTLEMLAASLPAVSDAIRMVSENGGPSAHGHCRCWLEVIREYGNEPHFTGPFQFGAEFSGGE